MIYVRIEAPPEMSEDFATTLEAQLQEAVAGVEEINRSDRDVKVTIVQVYGNYVRADVLLAANEKRTKKVLQVVAGRVTNLLADKFGNWHVATLVRTFDRDKTGVDVSYSK